MTGHTALLFGIDHGKNIMPVNSLASDKLAFGLAKALIDRGYYSGKEISLCCHPERIFEHIQDKDVRGLQALEFYEPVRESLLSLTKKYGSNKRLLFLYAGIGFESERILYLASEDTDFSTIETAKKTALRLVDVFGELKKISASKLTVFDIAWLDVSYPFSGGSSVPLGKTPDSFLKDFEIFSKEANAACIYSSNHLHFSDIFLHSFQKSPSDKFAWSELTMELAHAVKKELNDEGALWFFPERLQTDELFAGGSRKATESAPRFDDQDLSRSYRLGNVLYVAALLFIVFILGILYRAIRSPVDVKKPSKPIVTGQAKPDVKKQPIEKPADLPKIATPTQVTSEEPTAGGGADYSGRAAEEALKERFQTILSRIERLAPGEDPGKVVAEIEEFGRDATSESQWVKNLTEKRKRLFGRYIEFAADNFDNPSVDKATQAAKSLAFSASILPGEANSIGILERRLKLLKETHLVANELSPLPLSVEESKVRDVMTSVDAIKQKISDEVLPDINNELIAAVFHKLENPSSIIDASIGDLFERFFNHAQSPDTDFEEKARLYDICRLVMPAEILVINDAVEQMRLEQSKLEKAASEHAETKPVVVSEPVIAYVTGDFVRLRSSPQVLSDNIVTSLSLNDKLVMLREQPQSDGFVWWEVKTEKQQSGWIRGDFVYSSPVRKEKIINTDTNVRKGPSTSYAIIDVPKKGTEFVVLEESGGWLKVRYGNIPEGWLHNSNLVQKKIPKPKPASASKPSAQIRRSVNVTPPATTWQAPKKMEPAVPRVQPRQLPQAVPRQAPREIKVDKNLEKLIKTAEDAAKRKF